MMGSDPNGVRGQERPARGAARWRSPQTLRDRWTRRTVWLACVLALALSLRVVAQTTELAFLRDAGAQALDLGTRMVPPRWSVVPAMLGALAETVRIATVGTVVGALLAFPLAWLAARTTSPWIGARPIALGLLAVSRSVNSLVWALLLVVLLGPGPLAGALAIALRSVGFLGRLGWETIEEVGAAPSESLRASGASWWAQAQWGIWPAWAPSFWGSVVFRWEINLRESTVLGLVGAGGIGVGLQAAIDRLAWSEVTVVLLLILGTVVLAEAVSSRVREALRRGESPAEASDR